MWKNFGIRTCLIKTIWDMNSGRLKLSTQIPSDFQTNQFWFLIKLKAQFTQGNTSTGSNEKSQIQNMDKS